jgi:hypothetical protein
MTTTSCFQVNPDFYPDEKTCQESFGKKLQTNSRYDRFFQTHFTAGDVEQFETYRDKTNPIQKDAVEADEKLVANEFFEKFCDIPPIAVDNTFRYLFFKFKKGIFCKFKDGKMSVFLPFSNRNFSNEWSHKIMVDPKYGSMENFAKIVQEAEGRKFFHNSVNRNIRSWYANNCLVRYEYPPAENDTNEGNLSDMFLTLAKERKIPSVEFFVNRRDFPLLKRDGTEPYNHMFDTEDLPLLSHSYTKYCPILSMVTNDKFADIAIPTGDDWARVCYGEKYFVQSRVFGEIPEKPTPWSKRVATAVFRGASTGAGVTIETNPRLKVAHLSSTTEHFNDIPLLDAGITEWCVRARKIQGEKYLQTIDPKNFSFGLVEPLDYQQQMRYKYIVHISGHVSAFRLSTELFMGCCILLVEPEYHLWYEHMLVPMKHYIPVKKDLSDLIEKIKWCRKNDVKCRTIARNARTFAETYLTKKGILDYLENLMNLIKRKTGDYVYPRNLLDIRAQKEQELLTSYPKTIEGGEPKKIFSNNRTTIEETGNFIRKSSTDHKNLLHEAFVSHVVGAEYGFRKIIAVSNETIFLEKVDGQSLYQYINGKDFVFKDFLGIVCHLSMTLYGAQRKHCFVHNDLAPWNIILTKGEPMEYVVDHNECVRVAGKYLPVIIDLGRAHVVHENLHFGDVNMFRTSTIQDVVNLIVTCLDMILKFSLSENDKKTAVCMANFLSGTTYRKSVFREKYIGELSTFCKKARKFSEILFSDKGELEQKTPVDFVKYLIKNFPDIATVVTRVDREEKIPAPLAGDLDVMPKIVLKEDTFLDPDLMEENSAKIKDTKKLSDGTKRMWKIESYLASLPKKEREKAEKKYENILKHSFPNVKHELANIVTFVMFKKRA